MNRFIKIAAPLVLISMLSGCFWGEQVEVPPASVGMVMGKNGYQGDIIPPSRFRLAKCWFNCDKLTVIEAGDQGKLEKMEVLMPKDNLVLGVDVRFTVALSEERDQILSVFDRVVPVRLESGNFGTTLDSIYETYGAAVVRNVVRSTLANYTIREISSNQAAVSEELRQDVSEALAKTPLEIKQFGLAGLNYPSAVIEAMEATQRRKIDIERAEADAQVKIREAQARLEVSRAEREADLLEAKTIAEANLLLADGVTPQLLEYRKWQVIEKMSDNQNVVFFPVDMMNSLGLENKVYNSEKVNQ